MTFERLRYKNRERCEQFHPLESWTPSQWANAMGGEVGEVSAEVLAIVAALAAKSGAVGNLGKKMDRIWPANQFKVAMNRPEESRMADLTEKAGRELGDVIIYADLLATRLGLRLEDCVRESFNVKSSDLGITAIL